MKIDKLSGSLEGYYRSEQQVGEKMYAAYGRTAKESEQLLKQKIRSL